MLADLSFTASIIGKPHHMIIRATGATANVIMPENCSYHPRLVRANEKSTPELSVGVVDDARKPCKSDEWKSYPSEAIEELIQTSTGHIQSSYFRIVHNGQSFTFYAAPPRSFAFLSAACSAICVFAVEMVGVLLFTVYAGACSVGTTEYQQHINHIDREPKTEPVFTLPQDAELVECEHVGKKTQRTCQPLLLGEEKYFVKIIRYDFYNDRSNWRRLYEVYKKYGKLGDDILPEELVPARLLFGEFQVNFFSIVPSSARGIFGLNFFSFACLPSLGTRWR